MSVLKNSKVIFQTPERWRASNVHALNTFIKSLQDKGVEAKKETAPDIDKEFQDAKAAEVKKIEGVLKKAKLGYKVSYTNPYHKFRITSGNISNLYVLRELRLLPDLVINSNEVAITFNV